MVKKKKDDKVVEFAPKEAVEVVEQAPADPRANMTPEEIQAFMEQEEAALDAHLSKFIGNMPMPDTSSISEEDEEEEVVTLDFEKGLATEKIGEGVAVRNEDGNFEVIEGPVADKVKEVVGQTGQSVEVPIEPPKPELQRKYQDMITDRFVSKAISSLIEKLNRTSNVVFDEAVKGLPSAIGDHLAWEASEVLTKQKRELQLAISGGVVRYDRIPEWAKAYIDDYVYSGIGALIDFVERD